MMNKKMFIHHLKKELLCSELQKGTKINFDMPSSKMQGQSAKITDKHKHVTSSIL